MSGTTLIYRLLALLGLILAAATARAQNRDSTPPVDPIGPVHIEYVNDDGAHITIDTIAVDNEEAVALEQRLQPEMRTAVANGDRVTVTVDGKPRGLFGRWLDRNVYSRGRRVVEGIPFIQRNANWFFTVLRGGGVFSLTVMGLAGSPNEQWQSLVLGAAGGAMSGALQAQNPRVVRYLNGGYNIPIPGLREKTKGGMFRRWMVLEFIYMGAMAASGMAISAPSAVPNLSAWLAQSTLSAFISGWSQGSFDMMNAAYSEVRDTLFPNERSWNEFVVNMRTAGISVLAMSLAINQINHSGAAWATAHGLNFGPAFAQWLTSHGLGIVQQLLISDTFNIFEPTSIAMLIMGGVGYKFLRTIEARRIALQQQATVCKAALEPSSSGESQTVTEAVEKATPPGPAAPPAEPHQVSLEELARMLSSHLALPGGRAFA